MKITLCILTLNEIECLRIVFPKLSAPGACSGYDEIIAIDGGSTDGTIEFFQQNNVPVFKQSKKGRGEAFRLAIKTIDTDAFIFFSPDGNEEITDLNKFEKYLMENNSLVIASRMMAGAFNEEDVHWWKPRKWANLTFNLLANIFFYRKNKFITDSINGFRAITAGAAKDLKLTASDYTIEYQMTIKAMKKNLKIIEFPTYEGPRVARKSGIKSLPAGLRFLRRFLSELGRQD